MEEIPEKPVLDIPMLQPTSKPEHNGSVPPNEAQSASYDEASRGDFDAAYASEDSTEPSDVSEVDENSSDAEEQPQSASPEPDAEIDEVAPVDIDDEFASDTENLEVSAVNFTVPPDANPTKKTGPQNSNTDEMLLKQRIATGSNTDLPVENSIEETSVSKIVGNLSASDSVLTNKSSVNHAPSKAISASAFEAHAAKSLETQGGRLNRATESIAQTTVQLTAAVVQNQQQQTQVAQPVLPTNVQTLSDKRAEKGSDDGSRVLTEVSARTDTKAMSPFTTFNTAANQTASQSVLSLIAQQDTSALDVPMSASGDSELPTTWDARASAPSSLAQTLSRPETPGMIGRQMAEVLQRMPDRPVELSLNPEELGRVRLSISAAEGGITVSVLAERPETLDLMRRHIDQLAREFQALGYSDINFAFNEGQSDGNESQQEESNAEGKSNQQTINTPDETSSPIRLVAPTGVDLRL